MNIPYVGQVGAGAQEHGNDCGAACACMVIGWAGQSIPTVDALYNEVHPIGDSYLQVADVMRALLTRGIDCDWDAGVSTDRLADLVQKAPCIALIKYGDLEHVRPNPFNGSHFVVVVGADDKNIYIHDPLNTPTSGENAKISRAMWDDCWTGLDDQNPDRGLIIIIDGGEENKVKGTVLENGNGLAVRSQPERTGIVLKRLYTGNVVDIESIDTMWAKLKDGKYICVRMKGDEYVRVEE